MNTDSARMDWIIELLWGHGTDGLTAVVWDKHHSWDRAAIDTARQHYPASSFKDLLTFRRTVRSADSIIESKLDLIIKEQKRMADWAQEFQDDLTKLTTLAKANSDVLQQIESIVTTDAATITDLNTEVANLKTQIANGTTPDLSGLEAGIAALEANNTQAASFVAAANTATSAAAAPTGN